MRVAGVVVVLAASCAAPQKPSEAEAGVAPLPKSSIAAVLEHRVDLELTDAQIDRLDSIAAKLDDSNRITRESHKHSDAQPVPSKPPVPSDMGPRRGGGGRGGGGRRSSAAPVDDQRRTPVMQELDENDTRFFREAEDVFTEKQKAQAVQIASDYRELRFERRKLYRYDD